MTKIRCGKCHKDSEHTDKCKNGKKTTQKQNDGTIDRFFQNTVKITKKGLT
jgi:hypothetical protein